MMEYGRFPVGLTDITRGFFLTKYYVNRAEIQPNVKYFLTPSLSDAEFTEL